MEQFDALLAQTIDSTLGLKCTLYGYQYSEILRSLMCVYLCGGKERICDDMNVTSTKLLCRDCGPMNLDCVPPAESRPLFSSSSLFLRNGLRHHVGMYWIFTQTTMLMPTCSRQTLVKDHAFLVTPAYYLKSLYGVRGFCVCDISVVQEICTIKWILSLCKQNPTKPYRLRIWG